MNLANPGDIINRILLKRKQYRVGTITNPKIIALLIILNQFMIVFINKVELSVYDEAGKESN